MHEYADATEVVQQARLKLRVNLVPEPEQRSMVSARWGARGRAGPRQRIYQD
jgi:hypothetical protein